jgi:hypothetical protein
LNWENWNWYDPASEWRKVRLDSSIYDPQGVKTASFIKTWTQVGVFSGTRKNEYSYHSDGRQDFHISYQDSSGIWLKREKFLWLYAMNKDTTGTETSKWLDGPNRFEPIGHSMYRMDINGDFSGAYSYSYPIGGSATAYHQLLTYDKNTSYGDVMFPDDFIVPIKFKIAAIYLLEQNGANWDSLIRSSCYYSPYNPNGSDGVSENTWNIFPNPANEKVFLSIDRENGYCTLCVYDAKGRMVIKRNLAVGDTQVDVSALTEGIYWFRLENGLSRRSACVRIE